MNLWNYYDGDLKYPDLNNHSHEKEIAKQNQYGHMNMFQNTVKMKI